MKGKAALVLGMIAMTILSSGIASAGESMVLTTDKTQYTIGENVIITITNNCNDYLTIPDGFSVQNDAGETIFESRAVFYTPEVAPGDSVNTVWTQVANDGTTVTPGRYYITTSWDSVLVVINDTTASTNDGNGQNNAAHADGTVVLPTLDTPIRKNLPVRKNSVFSP